MSLRRPGPGPFLAFGLGVLCMSTFRLIVLGVLHLTEPFRTIRFDDHRTREGIFG